MRSPVTVIASFLIIVIGGLLVAPRFIDFSDHLDRGIADLSAQHGIVLTPSGSSELTLLPAPRLRLNAVDIAIRAQAPAAPTSETPSQPPNQAKRHYQARAVVLKFGLFDLFAGRVAVSSVELVGTRLKLDARQLQNAFDAERADPLPIRLILTDSVIDIALAASQLVLHDFSGSADLAKSFKPISLAGRFKYDDLPISISYEAAARAGKRLPISLRLDGGDELVFEFSGYMTDKPAREVSGEFSLSSRQALAPLLRSVGLNIPLATAHYLSISGLIYANEIGIQTDRLRVLGLGQTLTLQATLNRESDDLSSQLFLNLSAEKLDISGLTINERIEPLDDLWAIRFLSLLMPIPDQIDASINIGQIQLAGETIKGASVNIGFEQGRIRFHRVRAQLPFETSMLAAGELEVGDAGPHLLGNVALNIVNVPDFMRWLTAPAQNDFKFLRKMMDNTQFQRAHFSADIDLSRQRVAVTDVLAQMGDYEQAFDIIYTRGDRPVLEVAIETPILNLAEWGLVEADDIPDGEKRVSRLPIDSWFGAFMSDIPRSLIVPLRLKLGALTAGAVRLNDIDFSGEIKDGHLHLTEFRVGDYEGGRFDVSGVMAHDGRSMFGQIDMRARLDSGQPLTERMRNLVKPLKLQVREVLNFEGRLVLTAPDDEAWPAVQMQGALQIDELRGDASIFWPSRDLSRLVQETRMRGRLTGSANHVAELIGLRAVYPDDQAGLVLANLSMSNNTVGNLTVETNLGDDRIGFAGSVREVGVARELSGNMRSRLHLSVLNPVFSDMEIVEAAAQVVIGPTKTSFSGLSMGLGGGNVSGEGVIIFDGPRPEITASLNLRDLNVSTYLPEYKKGWSSEQMGWSIFGQTDANLEIQAERIITDSLKLDTVQGRLRLIDGVVEGRGIAIAALGGTLTVDVLAEGGTLMPSIRLDGRFVDVDASQFTIALTDHALLATRLSGQFSARTRGVSVDEFMGYLSGEVSADAEAGKLLFVDRNALAINVPANKPSLAAVSGVTDFSSALLLLKAEAGQITVTGAEFLMPQGPSWSLYGGVDLYRQTYDFALSFARDFGRQWAVIVNGPMAGPSVELRDQTPTGETGPTLQ